MKIETIETCPTCYGLGYNTTGSSSYASTTNGMGVIVHEENTQCPTCKGYGVILFITEVPNDISISEGKINKQFQSSGNEA